MKNWDFIFCWYIIELDDDGDFNILLNEGILARSGKSIEGSVIIKRFRTPVQNKHKRYTFARIIRTYRWKHRGRLACQQRELQKSAQTIYVDLPQQKYHQQALFMQEQCYVPFSSCGYISQRFLFFFFYGGSGK